MPSDEIRVSIVRSNCTPPPISTLSTGLPMPMEFWLAFRPACRLRAT
jgi:hypothetical protein